MSSRLVRGHELTDSCQTWQLPDVGLGVARGRGGTLDDARLARQQAVQEGFEEGRRAGAEAARKDVMAQARALERALDALARPFEALEQRFHEEILELVRAIARQLLRRELKLDPAHVIGVVREGLAALPMASTDIVVRMHPEDAKLMQDCLDTQSGDRAWRIEADPLMERGGCVIVTPQSQIDGRLDTRLARTVATMFDDERRESTRAPGTEEGH
jgi:flagellar assembly protein FliH